MAYVLLSLTVKPAGGHWFNHANAQVASSTFTAINSWASMQTGYKLHSTHLRNQDTLENLYVFDNQADAQAFKTALLTNASYQIVQNYYNANNMITTWREIP